MESWSVHHLFQEAEKRLGVECASSLQLYAQRLKYQGLPVIFSLGHLAKITHQQYGRLRASVNREREAFDYKMFAVSKRSGGRRFIHVATKSLKIVQHFINSEILQKISPHPASFAFHNSGGIKKCASMHCGARWLLQFDLKDFFYNVTEYDVYKVFKDLGFTSLLSFEMARLCTTTRLPSSIIAHRYPMYSYDNFADLTQTSDKRKYSYRHGIGVLPQGASTSPMLSNLATRRLDEPLAEYAEKNNLTYTRYADDLTFSCFSLMPGTSLGKIRNSIIDLIRKNRFLENPKKNRIAGPDSKKIVLGLLVDGEEPRLSKETYKRIERKIYASKKFGLVGASENDGFESAFGFYNHLSGLIAFVKDVDTKRWKEFVAQLNEIPVPWSGA